MDNFDRIDVIMQCAGRIWSECPIENEQVRDDLRTIVDNIKMIRAELIDLLHQMNTLRDIDLIDRNALKAKIYADYDRCHSISGFVACVLLRLEDEPTIKPDLMDGDADNG